MRMIKPYVTWTLLIVLGKVHIQALDYRLSSGYGPVTHGILIKSWFLRACVLNTRVT